MGVGGMAVWQQKSQTRRLVVFSSSLLADRQQLSYCVIHCKNDCEYFSLWCVADPFVRVSFLNYSQTTEIIEKTLCPTWDQTLIMENIEIYGRPEETAREPPLITIELFDYDTFVSWNLYSSYLVLTCCQITMFYYG